MIIAYAHLGVALVWGIPNAALPQPTDLETSDAEPRGCRIWRSAYLSGLHIVGERYGLRVLSGCDRGVSERRREIFSPYMCRWRRVGCLWRRAC